MKKSIYLFTLVGLLTISGIAETISGLVLWFALPSGGGRQSLDLTYWGLSRHTWTDIHDYVAVALIIIVAIHLLVHWKWVFRMIGQVFGQLREAYKTLQRQPKPDRA